MRWSTCIRRGSACRQLAALCRHVRRAARARSWARSARARPASASPTCAAACMPGSTRAPGSPPASASARCWSASPRPISARCSARGGCCWLGIVLFFITSLLAPLADNLPAFLVLLVPGRARLRHVHSADHQLRHPQPAGPARRLRPGAVRDELGTVAERRGVAGGLVRRPLVLALGLLAVLPGAAADVRRDLVRRAARAGQHRRCCGSSTGRAWPMPASASPCSTPGSTRATGWTGAAAGWSSACCWAAAS